LLTLVQQLQLSIISSRCGHEDRQGLHDFPPEGYENQEKGRFDLVALEKRVIVSKLLNCSFDNLSM